MTGGEALTVVFAAAAAALVLGFHPVAAFLFLAAAAIGAGLAWDEARSRDSRRRNRR